MNLVGYSPWSLKESDMTEQLHILSFFLNGETDIENRLMDMGRGEERLRCMEK